VGRFRVIGLLAVLAALALGVVACGGADSPDEVLSSTNLEAVESGTLQLALSVESGGGSLDVQLSGPFKRRGKDLPLADLSVRVHRVAPGGASIDLAGGLTLLSDRGFVDYKGVEYEIDPTNFEAAKSSFLPLDPGQPKGGKDSALSVCQEAAASLDLADFVINPVDAGSVDVAGTSTTKISGKLDLPAALDAIDVLAHSPACEAQLGAARRSAAEVERVENALVGATQTAHAEVYVGDDGIVRKFAGRSTIEPKGDRQPIAVNFELTLSDVNEEPAIKAPTGAKPILVWLQGFGVSPFDALFLVSEPEGLGRILELVAADALPAGAG
jgi:hypothetical protein